MMGIDSTQYLIIGFFGVVSWLVSNTLRRKFKQYSQAQLQANMTGAEVAAAMLAAHGIHDVDIISVRGQLTDHYNPNKKTVNLSEGVYFQRNAAATAVAAHEVGHAIQHAQSYSMLQMRSKLVPVVNVASKYLTWLIIGGILFIQTTPIPLILGVGLFGMTTLFSFVTLPVEFDASRRALNWIESSGVVTQQEYKMAKNALWWAAMTYVVAALASLANLMYYASFLFRGRR